MKRIFTKIDKIIIFCKDIQKTSSIYSETLGLRTYLQSQDFVQLQDANKLPIYLYKIKNPSQLSKGYSPMLSFNVQHFDEVYNKLLRYELIPDGQIIQTKQGKIGAFLGLDGETITINNLKNEEIIENEEQVKPQDEQIKNLLRKIKF